MNPGMAPISKFHDPATCDAIAPAIIPPTIATPNSATIFDHITVASLQKFGFPERYNAIVSVSPPKTATATKYRLAPLAPIDATASTVALPAPLIRSHALLLAGADSVTLGLLTGSALLFSVDVSEVFSSCAFLALSSSALAFSSCAFLAASLLRLIHGCNPPPLPLPSEFRISLRISFCSC